MLRRYSTQKSFLKYEQCHAGKSSHYIAIETQLNGDLNIKSLQDALISSAKKHPALRCVITSDDGIPDLKVNSSIDINKSIEAIDISNQDCDSTTFQQALVVANKTSFLTSPFDIENGPLWRAIIIKTGSEQYKLGFICHPAIADHDSIQMLLNDITNHYNHELSEQNSPNNTYDQSQINEISDDQENLRFWKNKLNDLTIPRLQTPKSISGGMRFQGKRKSFSLDTQLISQLQHNMPDNSLEEILLSSLYTILARYTGESDLTIGTAFSNRAPANFDINNYTSYLPLRLLIDENEKFSDLLTKTAKARTEAKAHPSSVNDIYEYALTENVRSALLTTAPFDVLLKYNAKAWNLNLNGISTSPPTQLDLGYNDLAMFQMIVNDRNDGSCEGFIQYNTDIFDDASIDRLISHWQKALNAVAQNPECSIHDIPLLLENEKTLINAFNDSGTTPESLNLMTPDAFSKVAKQIPDQTALAFHPSESECVRMSYKELDEYTNQIAHFLLTKCNLKNGDHIAFSIKRSVNLVALTLGALKAGLVITPLETSSEKLFEYKLKTTDASFIVTDKHTHRLFENLNNLNLDTKNTFVLNIDNPFIARRIRNANNQFNPPEIHPEDPAYIMYSSGTSTGTPKAILSTHGGLANLFHALRNQGLPRGLSVLCTAKPTFDAFLFDFLAAWSNSGIVHISSDEERYSPEAIERIIRQENINFAVFLPDLMSILPADLPLDYTISMGAAPRAVILQHWLKEKPGRKIYNGLGHTETGICLSLQEYEPDADPDLVGTPIDNMQMFILNPQHYTQCPIGVPGEIFVAGPGLASEYINNPELNQRSFLIMKMDQENNKFIPCDTNDPDAIRLYATGDYGCLQFTNNGSLAIKSTGRKDRKIKIFGVSIDLDGVEAIIHTIPYVLAVAVIPNQEKTGLLAYIVRTPEFQQISAERAKKILSKLLQESILHQVALPKRITFMTELTKSANGKVDTRELPLPPPREVTNLRPNLDIMQILANMWREILGSDDTDNIDPNAVFEMLGGNSITLANLECRINRELPLTKRIGFGKNLLSPQMTLNSLTHAIKPLLKDTAPIHSNQPNKSPIPELYRTTKQLLFNNKSGSVASDAYTSDVAANQIHATEPLRK